MVVPRSAVQLASDDEFALFAVVSFKKHSAEFLHKCREKRWTPRDYKYKEGGKEEEAKEASQLAQDAQKQWGEALRLGRTGYSESAMIWIHVLALRVFVETVLRYGLPLDFVCGLVQVRSHSSVSRYVIALTPGRRTPSSQRKQNQTSTPTTRTLAATPSIAIVKVVSRKTTLPRQMTCRRLGIWAIRNIPLMYITSSKSTEGNSFNYSFRGA